MSCTFQCLFGVAGASTRTQDEEDAPSMATPNLPLRSPVQTNKLIGHPRVICTPHLGASTSEALEGVAIEVVEAVLDALEGKLSLNALNAPMVRTGDPMAPPW